MKDRDALMELAHTCLEDSHPDNWTSPDDAGWAQTQALRGILALILACSWVPPPATAESAPEGK